MSDKDARSNRGVSRQASGEYKVSGLLDLDTVADYRDAGFEAVRREAETVRFDMSEAHVDGSAVIALLIAWQREAEREKKQVKFVNCPDNLLAIADACGVSEILQCG